MAFFFPIGDLLSVSAKSGECTMPKPGEGSYHSHDRLTDDAHHQDNNVTQRGEEQQIIGSSSGCDEISNSN